MSPKNDGAVCNSEVILEKLEHIESQTDDVHVALYGKPDNPETGLLFRMQKIEVEARTKKHMITSIAAWISLAISTVIGIISMFSTRY